MKSEEGPEKISGLSPFFSPHSLINQALQDYSSAALPSMPGRLHENP
jgi:hypothetical protein